MIAIGCDHGGFALKQEVMRHLDELGLAYKDFGTYSEESCDYPIYGEAVARAVAAGECERGILICGTGIGISISANKVKGIRAAHLSLIHCLLSLLVQETQILTKRVLKAIHIL